MPRAHEVQGEHLQRRQGRRHQQLQAQHGLVAPLSCLRITLSLPSSALVDLLLSVIKIHGSKWGELLYCARPRALQLALASCSVQQRHVRGALPPDLLRSPSLALRPQFYCHSPIYPYPYYSG